MFDKLIRELEALQRTKKFFIPIKADKDGYLDRKCPNKECNFQFKVHEEDWKNKVRDEEVFCPMCRCTADANSWMTSHQKKNAENQISKHIHGRIGRAMQEDAMNFNAKQQRNSFLQMSLSVSGTHPYHHILPIAAQKEMLLKITCCQCHARYAVIGSAFFCPACGYNSAEETFDNSLKKVETKLKNISVIRKAIQITSKDEAEIACSSLIETSLSDCVVAFQRFCEVVYSRVNPSEKIKFNAFQNLDAGGEYWKSLFGKGYADWLSPIEYSELNKLFQKRHLLAHREGMVDQKYLDKSGDSNYKLEQRIVVNEKDVIQLKDTIQKLAGAIRERIEV